MTRLLCLDTTAAHCAVALIDGKKVLSSNKEPMTKGQAERLFPMIDETLQTAGLSLKDLDAISVATGPGNFTGVRICVSAARGLALSLGIPAIGVSCLEALAYGHTGDVLAVLDARADHVYYQIFCDPKMPKDPTHMPRSELTQAVGPVDMCVGFNAADIAAELGAAASSEQMPAPEIYGFIAQTKDWTSEPRPAPLYLRSPDAALPSEPAPHIIP